MGERSESTRSGARDYPDFLLEVWSDEARQKKGWMQKDLQIDYLAYGFLMSRRCYLFPWLLLQAAWRDHQTKWLEDAEANRGGFKVVRGAEPNLCDEIDCDPHRRASGRSRGVVGDRVGRGAMSPLPIADIHESPYVGTRFATIWPKPNGKLVVHCINCLLQMDRGVMWHDERTNCPTWTGGALDGRCCCDTEQ